MLTQKLDRSSVWVMNFGLVFRESGYHVLSWTRNILVRFLDYFDLIWAIFIPVFRCKLWWIGNKQGQGGSIGSTLACFPRDLSSNPAWFKLQNKRTVRIINFSVILNNSPVWSQPTHDSVDGVKILVLIWSFHQYQKICQFLSFYMSLSYVMLGWRYNYKQCSRWQVV